ncbi:hypothetical protein ACQKHQ_12300, partial [Staphylococcus hominis]
MEVIKAKTDMSEDQQFDFYENMFNALADKIRLKILNQISQSFNKSLCVCDLEELDKMSVKYNDYGELTMAGTSLKTLAQSFGTPT